MPTKQEIRDDTNANKREKNWRGFVDYNRITIPEKSLKELSTRQRRAKLLQMIILSGSPFAVTKTAYAKEFGVSVWTICNDFLELDASLKLAATEMTKDMPTYTKIIMTKVTKDLLNDKKAENKFKAAQTTKMLNDYLMDLGELNRKPAETIQNTILTTSVPVEIKVIMPSGIVEDIKKSDESKKSISENSEKQVKKEG